MNSTARHLWILAVAAITGAAALLCLASCNRSKTSAELERISLLTEENPDSALSLLLATDTAAFADEAERACFAVALTNARYLAYDPTCNDSLLSLHTGYFADAPADRFKMLYLYLSATFKIERKLFTEAIIELFDAAQIAEAADDHLYAGRIYRAISDLYNKCFDSKQYLKYSYLSLFEFQKCDKPSFANWQLMRIAQAYHNIKDYAKSLIICKLAYNKAINEQDKNLEEVIKRIAARDYMKLKQYVEAINELSGLDYFVPEDYYTLSYSYLSLNEIDSAIFYNNKLLELQPFNKELTFRIAKKTGDIKTMADELDSEFHRQSDFISAALNYNIAGIESQYHQRILMKNKLKLKTQFEIFVIIAVILIASTIILYILHRKTLKFKESEIEKYSLMAKNLQIKFNKLSSGTSNSINSDFSLINELSQEFFLSDKSDTNKIYSKVQKIIEDYRSSDETLKQLEQNVDLAYDGLATRFKNELPEIYSIYNRLFLLIALDFDSQSIPTHFRRHSACILQQEKPSCHNTARRHIRFIRPSSVRSKIKPRKEAEPSYQALRCFRSIIYSL